MVSSAIHGWIAKRLPTAPTAVRNAEFRGPAGRRAVTAIENPRRQRRASVSQSFFAIATRPPDPSPSGNRHTNIRGGAVAWREFPRGTHAGAVAPRPVGRTHTHAPGLRVPGYRPAQVGVPHSRVGHHATRTPHVHIHTYRWVEHGRDPGALKCAPASTERCAHPVVLKQRSHHPPLLLHRVRFPWPPPRIAPRCLGQPV
jgi:hypothetical protein